MTKIIACTCSHPSQDKLHGKNLRVHNEVVSKSPSTKIYRCTVCLKEKIQ